MSERLHGLVALVTGGTRGVGLGIARELDAAGARVYVTGRDEERLAAAPGTGLRCDHRDDAAVEKVFAAIASDAGPLDVLVNCVATVPEDAAAYAANFQPFWRGEPAVWDTWCDIGLRSHYVASIYAARQMVPRGTGLIVNVSSAAAAHYFLSVAYGVGKAALDRFTADAAVQLREHGVSVVSIWPGAVRTEKTESFEAAGLASLGDAESPELAGRAVVALATDPDVVLRSGSARYVAELARAYGFTELDGSQPPLPTYGGVLQHQAST
jgi:NAD(P)-dependent dehydrogenase (short-subunit alcohol dehydrogenase family)